MLMAKPDLDILFKVVDDLLYNMLEATKEGSIKYIEEAYKKGLDKANSDLKKYGWTFDIPPDPHSIEFLEQYTFDLITGVGEDVRKEIRRVVRQGILDGKSMRKVAKELRDVGFTRKKWRLNTIARTEVMRASNYGRLEGYKKSVVVKYKQWLTAFDDRTCPECEVMNGEIAEIDKPFSSGEQAPPLHPNCRCTIVPVFEKKELRRHYHFGRKDELNVKRIEAKFARHLQNSFKEIIKAVIELISQYWGVLA